MASKRGRRGAETTPASRETAPRSRSDGLHDDERTTPAEALSGPPDPPSARPPSSPSEGVVPAPPGVSPGRSGTPLGAVTWGWWQSLLGLLVAVAPVIALTLLSLATDAPADGGSSPATTQIALVAVAITLVLDGWYLFAAWLFSLRVSHAGLTAWGFRRPRLRILWAVPLGLVMVYGVSIAYNLLVQTEEQDIIQSFPRSVSGGLLFVLLACVIAPLFEETFFRGFLFQGFARSWGVVVGAVVSAVVFSLAHQQLDIFVPLFALGLALAWVYHTTRSVWGSIALHAVYNGLAVLVWAFTG